MLEPKSPSSSSLLMLGPPGSGLLPQAPGTRRDPQSPELEPPSWGTWPVAAQIPGFSLLATRGPLRIRWGTPQGPG